VWKLVLSPRWWGGHLLVVIGVLVMLRLGLWQWHRAQSPSGGIQNYAYAFQWPLFAVFALVLWWRTLKIEAARAAAGDNPDALDRPLSRLGAEPFAEPDIDHLPGVRVGITTVAPIDDAEDEEVRVYNAYLARLNAANDRVTQGRARQA
jgi:hypothetical protein